jgi:hypothetical protein
MFNKSNHIGRLGQLQRQTRRRTTAAEESWKNDKGGYDPHRVASRLRLEQSNNGTLVWHRIAEIHATSMKRLSKIEVAR